MTVLVAPICAETGDATKRVNAVLPRGVLGVSPGNRLGSAGARRGSPTGNPSNAGCAPRSVCRTYRAGCCFYLLRERGLLSRTTSCGPVHHRNTSRLCHHTRCVHVAVLFSGRVPLFQLFNQVPRLCALQTLSAVYSSLQPVLHFMVP